MESDPRYSTLLSLARNAQQMQHLPGFPSDSSGSSNISNMMPASGQMGLTSTNEGFLDDDGSSLQGKTNGGLTADQINQLRSQIVAYKMLSHNQPLTDQIKMAIQSKGGTPSQLASAQPTKAEISGI